MSVASGTSRSATPPPPGVGVPEPRPVGHFDCCHQPDEPAAPDRNRCGIPNHVRVGQGARRNPVPYGIHAGPQQAGAPGPEPPARMRSDIADRMPPPPAAQSRCVYHRQLTSVVQGLPEHTASIGPGKVLAQQWVKDKGQIFPFHLAQHRRGMRYFRSVPKEGRLARTCQTADAMVLPVNKAPEGRKNDN